MLLLIMLILIPGNIANWQIQGVCKIMVAIKDGQAWISRNTKYQIYLIHLPKIRTRHTEAYFRLVRKHDIHQIATRAKQPTTSQYLRVVCSY